MFLCCIDLNIRGFHLLINIERKQFSPSIVWFLATYLCFAPLHVLETDVLSLNYFSVRQIVANFDCLPFGAGRIVQWIFQSFLLLLLDIHHVVFLKDFGCAPQHGIFLCGNFMKVNSSGLLGMGPALQSPMDASDASFTLPGRVLASSAFCSKLSVTVAEREREDSGHVAGLMGTDVSVDVFERQTERVEARPLYTKWCRRFMSSPRVAMVSVKLNLTARIFYERQ